MIANIVEVMLIIFAIISLVHCGLFLTFSLLLFQSFYLYNLSRYDYPLKTFPSTFEYQTTYILFKYMILAIAPVNNSINYCINK